MDTSLDDNYWRAPGYNPSHDYDPIWDYIVIENTPPGMHEALDRLWERIQNIDEVDPYLVAAAEDLPDESVAMYVDGTSSSPVIVIDWSMVGGNDEEIALTILHELRHAQQEMTQEYDEIEKYDELDAESWARETWTSIDHGHSL